MAMQQRGQSALLLSLCALCAVLSTIRDQLATAVLPNS